MDRVHHGEGILLFVCQSGVLGLDNYAMQNHEYKILACSIFTLKTCKLKKIVVTMQPDLLDMCKYPTCACTARG